MAATTLPLLPSGLGAAARFSMPATMATEDELRRITVIFAQNGNARLVVSRDAWDDLLVRDVDLYRAREEHRGNRQDGQA